MMRRRLKMRCSSAKYSWDQIWDLVEEADEKEEATVKGESGGFVKEMKGVLEECEEEIKARADGPAAGEDHNEGVGSGDGVHGWGVAIVVLGGGEMPEGCGGGGRVDSVAFAGSK
ncbi:hypothetical protein RHGRI_026688 [Rhododendron griersonianum]|uniref:Uncharacterized protein n=1 Tax=Rhododendron griersonianum TaxID=479676 RepID=A0AAV6ITU4_9ERIC|nr:hypothetical protein RHGRI_026688 [Rhododendron griersonianum]